MTRTHVVGRLAATAVLFAVPALGFALASPAAAAACDGVEVVAVVGGATCLDASGESVSVNGTYSLFNNRGTAVEVEVDPDGPGEHEFGVLVLGAKVLTLEGEVGVDADIRLR
ncbi:hypothetical protein [Streptomyces candidus]|uniref:Uncharacterized protein n=1 Tax=Streptomyces candidus TaxID=67283 RepID=A0A7X0HL68_9ACTN|nr:hypothetical protein [Streptomyces candidus]MBB6439705.1 hypothetical protein [Streptomyces candidus]GHH56641.1 hypothetical protein GCM10018773_62860 [Streptomyces candidus]